MKLSRASAYLLLASSLLVQAMACQAAEEYKKEIRALVRDVRPVAGAGDRSKADIRPLADSARALGKEDSAISVRQDGKDLRVAVVGDVLFAFDSTALSTSATATLERVATLVAKAPAGRPIVIEGHTDAKGSAAYNQTLSLRRAEAVKQWLVSTHRIDASRLRTLGYGAKRPVAQETLPGGADSPEGRKRNRRVEFVFAQQ